MLLVCAPPAYAASSTSLIPLPQPRPAGAPQVPGKATSDRGETPAQPADKPSTAEQKPLEVPQPSACRMALTDAIAIAPSVPDIKGPGACGGPDLVHLEAIVLPDQTRVPLKPGGIMRCSMAMAVADWVRSDMAPLATSIGTKLAELDNFDSFDCRGRNRIVGAKLSEHGRANALDVRALKLANGQSIALTDRATPREWREKVLYSVCSRFSTVLGPGSDGYHEDHIHLDLAERRNNYKICEWNIWENWPQVAPLMPQARPSEAPPRVVAEEGEAKQTEPAVTQPETRVGPESAQPAEEAVPAQPAARPEIKSKAKAKKPHRQRTPPPFPLNLLR